MGPDDPIFADAPKAVAAWQNPFPIQAYSTIDLARDVGFPDFIRGGTNFAGASLNRRTVMRNASVKRCVTLLSNCIGMLPLHLLRNAPGGKKEKATSHPLYGLLSTQPNSWQDSFQFRRLMQRRALIDGDAYALIIRSRGVITSLVPICPTKVKVEQRDDWSVIYKVSNKAGGERTVKAEDMFHLYGDSDDGVSGVALVDEAADVLGLSLQADKAAAKLFRVGALIRDVLSKEGKLSPEAIARLKGQLSEEFSGADNASKTLVLEEGLKYESVQSNAKDSQHLETRRHQIEEVARIFGVPRPFLMMDDTSWGSGIEQLGIYFVQYGLNPWFVAWEKAIGRALLSNEDRRSGLYAKFNERALLRGTMKDQAEYLSKLMGSGGSPQIAEQNEARDWLDLPEHPDGFGLNSGVVNGGADNGTTGQDQA